MAKAAIRQFVVGKDFSIQEIELLVLKLAKWFRDPKCDRRFEDPEAAAKDVVNRCLNAETKDGNPWRNAPKEFAARIKVTAAYDMLTDTGIPIQANKHPDAVRQLQNGAEKNGAQVNALNAANANFDPTTYRVAEEAKLLTAHPELNNPAMLPHVRRLTMLYAQQEMLDNDLLLSQSAAKREAALRTLKVLNETLDSVLKILDIHPESLRKKMKEAEDGTLGDLVQMLDSDIEFKDREKLWALQAAVQFWWMTQHKNGRGDGPQLTEWELWHMTRTRPFSFTCKCGAYYPAIVQGFTPKEIKKLLIEQGILVSKAAVPKLMPEGALDGIDAAIDAMVEPA